MRAKVLKIVPTGVTSAAVTALLLYFSLSPRPVGAEMALFFPGADKAVHFIMYLGVTGVYLLDHTRREHPRRAALRAAALITLGAVALGGLLEIAQGLTGRRTSDILDFAANSAGCLAALAAVRLWLGPAFSKFITRNNR